MGKEREILLEVCREPAEGLEEQLEKFWALSLRRQLRESGWTVEEQVRALEQIEGKKKELP